MDDRKIRRLLKTMQSDRENKLAVSELLRIARRMRTRIREHKSRPVPSRNAWASSISRNAKIEVYESLAAEFTERASEVSKRRKKATA